MKLLVEKIELLDGDYWGRKIRLKITPAPSLNGCFIKLKNRDEDSRYVPNAEFKKNGYNQHPHKIPNYETEGYVTADFYLTFLVGGKKSIDDIQFLHDEDNFNYVYESHHHELSGYIHLDDKKFEIMWSALVNKVFPSSIDLFISHEYYSNYDYYVQPWTPWDLSSLEPVSSHAPGNPSVPIINYSIQYDLLETNEHEINKVWKENHDKLNTYEVEFLYSDTKNNDVIPSPEKVLYIISRQIGILSLFLLAVIVIQIIDLFL